MTDTLVERVAAMEIQRDDMARLIKAQASRIAELETRARNVTAEVVAIKMAAESDGEPNELLVAVLVAAARALKALSDSTGKGV